MHEAIEELEPRKLYRARKKVACTFLKKVGYTMRDDRRGEEELKNAMQQIYEHIEIPDSTESWKRVQKRLAQRRRRKRWLNGAGFVACILIGSLIISNMWTHVPSVYSFSSLFKNMKETVVEIFHEQSKQDHSGALTLPPVEDETPNASANRQESIIVTVEEAQSKLTYKLLLPEYMPETYALDKIRVFGSQDDDRYNSALVQYVDADGYIMHIMQRQIEGDTDGLKMETSAAADQVLDVLVNDVPALLVIPNEGNLHLEWLTPERVLIRISGDIPQDEILSIAKSFN